MSLPVNNSTIGIVYQPTSFQGLFNENITVKDTEEDSFDTPEAAQERADEVAQSEDVDAAVVRGDDGKYHVVHIDEVRNLEPKDNAVQGQFRLHTSDPNVISFSVSRQNEASSIQRVRPESGAEEMTQKNALLAEHGLSIENLKPLFEDLLLQLSAEDLARVLNGDGNLEKLHTIAENPFQQEIFQTILNGEASNLDEVLHTVDMMQQTIDSYPEAQSQFEEAFRNTANQGLSNLQDVIINSFLQYREGAGDISSDEIVATNQFILDELMPRGVDIDYGDILRLVDNHSQNGRDSNDILAAIQAYAVAQDALQSLDGQFPPGEAGVNYQGSLEGVRDQLISGNIWVDDDTLEKITDGTSVYRHTEDTVFQRDFDINDTGKRGLLLHEMIHGAQDHNASFMQKASSELDAYLVQGLYELANGNSSEGNPILEYAQLHLDNQTGNASTDDVRAAREDLREFLESLEVGDVKLYEGTLDGVIGFKGHSH